MARIARRPGTAVVAIGVLTFLLCAGMAQLYPTIPRIQDEFSYLLAADTYSEGRLSNPTHPLWRFFDAPHVNQEPTYQSKYQPGQGMALAFGRLLTGSALIGVWISLALAIAATCWMLQAWLPPPWPLLGGLLAASNALMLRYWGGTYMGGAVAMLGGALLFGALVRSLDDPRPRNGFLMGSGLLILANTRPFEGLVASLPILLVLLVWLLCEGRYRDPRLWRRLLLPLGATLAVGLLWMAYYNYRVTGEPLTLPYQVYLERHGSDVLGPIGHDQQGLEGHPDDPREYGARLKHQAVFHLGGRWLFALPVLIALPGLLKSGWGSLALATTLFTMLVASRSWGVDAHYTAPVSALVIGLVTQSLGVITGWLRRREVAMATVGLFLVAWFHTAATIVGEQVALEWRMILRGHVIAGLTERAPDWDGNRTVVERRSEKRHARSAIYARQHFVDLFANDTERHLVLVRYNRFSMRHREWVYNRARIDEADTVWAAWTESRPLWPLLEYFADRRVWYIEPEKDPWTMRGFPRESVGVWYLREQVEAGGRLLPNRLAVDPVRVEIDSQGTASWHLQLERAHPPVEKGRSYHGSFRARADAPRWILVGVSQAREPWRNLGFNQRYEIDTEWTRFHFDFVATADEPVPRLAINVGLSDVAIEISDVELSEGSAMQGAGEPRAATDQASAPR